MEDGGRRLASARIAGVVRPTAIVFLPVPMVTDKRLGALVAALCLGVWGALLLLAVRALVRRRRAAA
jgi:hypothetical protein